MRASWLVLAVGSLSVSAAALPPDKERVVVDEAKKLLGVPYDLGGRLRNADDGIDCQGLVFFALQPIATCGWKSWSVMPTVSVPERQLGAVVEGLAPIATDALAALLERDASALRAGDVVHFVGFDENSAEPAIAALHDGEGARPVWVWHMGLASGGGRFVVGDHFAGEVVEEDLVAYLRAHADVYAGVLVTRMHDGPRVDDAKCRRHAPMRAPRTAGTPNRSP